MKKIKSNLSDRFDALYCGLFTLCRAAYFLGNPAGLTTYRAYMCHTLYYESACATVCNELVICRNSVH